jgi:predicted nucleic acid-binding protein
MAKRFLQRVQDGKYEGVVSLLTLMELTKNVRSLCVKLLGEYDSRSWNERMAEAYKVINSIKNIKIIEGNPDERVGTALIKDILYSDIVKEAHSILAKYSGKVYDDPEKGFIHSGLNCVDGLHIILAKRTGCYKIATFDNGFLETASEIVPLLLQKDLW